MKKISALIMFTLLATVGYYIGNAVAQSKNSPTDQTDGNGILVVEEEYGVVVPAPANAADQAKMPVSKNANQPNVATPAANSSMSGQKGNTAGKYNNNPANNNDDVTVDETVTQEGYVVE